MFKTKTFEVGTGQDLYLLWEGWLRMDAMERSQSLNREALRKILDKDVISD